MYAEALDGEGGEQIPRPTRGSSEDLTESFPAGLIELGQQKRMGPVSLSTCLLNLYLVSHEHLPPCGMLRAVRQSPPSTSRHRDMYRAQKTCQALNETFNPSDLICFSQLCDAETDISHIYRGGN